jgi:malonyl-CoA/methylmalonyl-CoA synthetase
MTSGTRAAILPDDDLRAAAALPTPGVVTYEMLHDRARSVASWLRGQGVGRGDRVAIQLENGMDLVDLHLACVALGAVRVPLNVHYRAAELAPILEDAAPVLVVSRDPSQVPPSYRTVSGIATGTPYADPDTMLDRMLGAGGHPPATPPVPDAATAWLFTSGTTGRAKGAPQTWSMWHANLSALATRWRLSAEDRLWLSLPMFHTHGLVIGLHGTLLRGASLRLSSGFRPVAPPADVTHVYGVPTYWRRWLDGVRREDWSGVRLLVSGSDGLPAEVSDAVHAATGHRILERYGMTETVMIASNPFDGERRAGTVGTPLDDTDVRIEDGEVQVRGASVFAGYHPRPDPGAFTADGWFRTGDAGAWDPDGYLRIVGRMKELVIVGGVNVGPAEVERVLAQVPGVADLACCGLPDDDLGEIVAAAVVPDGTCDVTALRARLEQAARALSGLKRPRAWAFVDALPRNAMGKTQRARVRREIFGRA